MTLPPPGMTAWVGEPLAPVGRLRLPLGSFPYPIKSGSKGCGRLCMRQPIRGGQHCSREMQITWVQLLIRLTPCQRTKIAHTQTGAWRCKQLGTDRVRTIGADLTVGGGGAC